MIKSAKGGLSLSLGRGEELPSGRLVPRKSCFQDAICGRSCCSLGQTYLDDGDDERRMSLYRT